MKSEQVKTIADAAMYFRQEYADIFTEAYQVGHCIEVVVKARTFRIEPIEALSPATRTFDVRVYEMKVNMWERWLDFPWCNRPTPESVMMQALSFFRDRFPAP